MAEETQMLNIDINQFSVSQSVSDTDFIVLSLGNGLSARMTVGLLKSMIASNITPSVKSGIWYVGPTSLGLNAEGKTPEFRRGSLGIEYKYTTDDSTSWQLLVPYSDIGLQFSMLSDDEKQEIFDNVSLQVKDDIIAEVKPQVKEEIIDELGTTVKDEIVEIVTPQVKEEVLGEVDKATAEAKEATEKANSATQSATAAATSATQAANNASKAAEAANAYANRVLDVTESEWALIEQAGSWKEGVEYNVYPD